ncbi:hypothetical protein AB0H18_22120 [Streptomyces sp. NPDC020766]
MTHTRSTYRAEPTDALLHTGVVAGSPRDGPGHSPRAGTWSS